MLTSRGFGMGIANIDSLQPCAGGGSPDVNGNCGNIPTIVASQINNQNTIIPTVNPPTCGVLSSPTFDANGNLTGQCSFSFNRLIGLPATLLHVPNDGLGITGLVVSVGIWGIALLLTYEGLK